MKIHDGYTLMHEHMSINLSSGDLASDSFDLLCADLKMAYHYGVRNIVDLTNQSMGRDPAYVKRLMDATGINIILSTGYYVDQYIHTLVEGRTVEDLADEAIADLTRGIGDSGMKAGVIGEIGWCHEGPYEIELKSWEAMCIAASKTGAPISTHTSRGIQQIPQAEYLLSYGIPAPKILIGHIEFYRGDVLLKALLKKGVYIGLDMIGKEGGKGDEYRADTVAKIKDWGYLPQLFLSMDICRREDLRSSGGYGYAYLFETFIPMLKARGIQDEDIDLILRDNPKRYFA